MTVLRRALRRGALPNWLVAFSVAAAAVAAVPVAIGIIESGGGGQPPTAFASAPSGDYAVVAASSDTVDVIRVVRAGGSPGGDEVARVDHLPGFYSTGSVSPDGRLLALVAVDAGTPTRPGASLLLVDLESGSVTRLAVAVMGGQKPVWAADSRSVVVTCAVAGSSQSLEVSRFPVDLSPATTVDHAEAGMGLYPLGFDTQGRLISILIEDRGSSLRRAGEEIGPISGFITRDWQLSPDATQLAFIEVDTSQGLQYKARVVSVEPASGGAGVTAQGLSRDGQQLGAAWRTGDPTPAFGQDPGSGAVRAAGAQPGGFDIPLAYASSGAALAVQHWSGESFTAPGQMTFALVDGDTRTPLPDATAFYGWARR